jgi:RNA polymerase sigma-70 factor, ECF subfamily
MFRPVHTIQRARIRRRPRSPSPVVPEGPVDETAEDERLIAAAQQGDLDAFNRIVDRHQRAVFNVCLRLLRDVALAEDATQDTFLRAWAAVDRFHGGAVRPWLLRIATNRAYDLLRVRARRPTDSLDLELEEVAPRWTSQAAPAESPDAFAVRTELSLALDQALATLPDDQRLAIILTDVHGYGYDEAAAITGVALGTVKSRVSRGRARLREELQREPAKRELFARLLRITQEGETA